MIKRNASKTAIVLDMFCDVNGGASTKRIIGCIGYISGLVLAFMHYDESLVAIVLTSAVSLIIGTALEKKYDEREQFPEDSSPPCHNSHSHHNDIKYE